VKQTLHRSSFPAVAEKSSPNLAEKSDQLHTSSYAVYLQLVLGSFDGLWPPVYELLQLLLDFKQVTTASTSLKQNLLPCCSMLQKN
jgi:hypothetical protein